MLILPTFDVNTDIVTYRFRASTTKSTIFLGNSYSLLRFESDMIALYGEIVVDCYYVENRAPTVEKVVSVVMAPSYFKLPSPKNIVDFELSKIYG